MGNRPEGVIRKVEEEYYYIQQCILRHFNANFAPSSREVAS
jgi:hypothetical protein